MCVCLLVNRVKTAEGIGIKFGTGADITNTYVNKVNEAIDRSYLIYVFNYFYFSSFVKLLLILFK